MSKQIKADLLLLLITVIWGSSFTLMKNVLVHIPSFAYLSLRYLVALAILAVIFHRKFRGINARSLIHGFLLGIMMVGGMGFQVTGLYWTTASNSAFITGTSVVFVPVVSTLFLKKRPEWNSVIGVVLAFAGLFFLSGGLDFRFNFGDFLTLLCAFCWTFHIILIDRFTENADPELLSMLQIGFAALMFCIIWGIFEPEPVTINGPVVVTLLITGVFGTALAYAGQTIVQKFTTPTHTALIFSAEPVFGAVFALLIPAPDGSTEKLTMTTVAGCLLILVGMLISELKVFGKGRTKPAEPPAMETE